MKTHRPAFALLLLGLLLAAPLPRALPARAVEAAPDGTWTALPPLQTARTSHTATTLADGRVLVAGAGSSEVFDPATGRWSAPAPARLTYAHTATLLPDGQVLTTGAFAGSRGASPGDPNPVGRQAERYDPATERGPGRQAGRTTRAARRRCARRTVPYSAA